MKKVTSLTLTFASAALVLSSCQREGCTDPLAWNYSEKAKKDDGSCQYVPHYPVPDTYNFENVSYSGQTERLNMLDEMGTYMKTGNTGAALSATKLKEMYANTGGHFSFTSTKKLKDKTYSLDVPLFESWMDSIELASQSGSTGSNGVAGLVTSSDGTKTYLFDGNGREFGELIQKGLMGAVFYYQATGHYLTEDQIGNGVDNSTVTPGEGTPMQHHWDEAFGYFGVPVDFPANTSGIRYFGKYSNSRNSLLHSNDSIMDAFIAGRAAINFEDYDTRDIMASKVKKTWEDIAAATAISYLNKAKSHLSDDALRNHELSEAWGFIMALKYNPDRRITDAQLGTILGYIGHNFYNVTVTGIDNARNELSTIYGFGAIKDQL